MLRAKPTHQICCGFSHWKGTCLQTLTDVYEDAACGSTVDRGLDPFSVHVGFHVGPQIGPRTNQNSNILSQSLKSSLGLKPLQVPLERPS